MQIQIINSDAKALLRQCDTIILDIDGVLVSVVHSFRKSICETLCVYFTDILKWRYKKSLFTIADTEKFKLAGGFNDDWDLTFGAALFFIFKAVKYADTNLLQLQNKKPSLNTFLSKVKHYGGGLSSAEYAAKESGVDVAKVKTLWRRTMLKQIFCEIYAGEDLMKKIYGTKARYVKQKGLVHTEENILKTRLPEGFKYGIITGRTWPEAKTALQKLRLHDKIARNRIVCQDDGMKKPDARCLQHVVNVVKPRCGIYVGDTLDDLRLVKHYNTVRKETDPPFLFSFVFTGAEKDKYRSAFRKEGTDVFAKDVNVLLNFLKHERENAKEK